MVDRAELRTAFQASIAPISAEATAIWDEIKCNPFVVQPAADDSVAVRLHHDPKKITEQMALRTRRLARQYGNLQKEGFLPTSLPQVTKKIAQYLVAMSLRRHLVADKGELESLQHLIFEHAPKQAFKEKCSHADACTKLIDPAENVYFTWAGSNVRLTREVWEAAPGHVSEYHHRTGRVSHFRYMLSDRCIRFNTRTGNWVLRASIWHTDGAKAQQMPGPWLGVTLPSKRGLDDFGPLFFKATDDLEKYFQIVT